MLEIVMEYLDQISTYLPSQWEGKTTEGKYVYIRCKYNELTVDIADSELDFNKDNYKTVFCMEDSNFGDGIDTDWMLEVTGIKLK